MEDTIIEGHIMATRHVLTDSAAQIAGIEVSVASIPGTSSRTSAGQHGGGFGGMRFRTRSSNTAICSAWHRSFGQSSSSRSKPG